MQGIANKKIDGINCTINMARSNNYNRLHWEVIDILNVLPVNNLITVDIFGNEKSLRKIWSENGTLTITTNARNIILKLIGDFPGCFHPV